MGASHSTPAVDMTISDQAAASRAMGPSVNDFSAEEQRKRHEAESRADQIRLMEELKKPQQLSPSPDYSRNNQQGGSPKLNPTSQRVKIGNRNRIVYTTTRGKKYIKMDGELLTAAQVKKTYKVSL